MDKGDHSKDNQTELKKIVDLVVVPKKGRLNSLEREEENDPQFIKMRRQHSAIESAINALDVHGLDCCPDGGIDGFKRYVALEIVARNIQHMGKIMLQKDLAQQRRQIKKAA